MTSSEATVLFLILYTIGAMIAWGVWEYSSPKLPATVIFVWPLWFALEIARATVAVIFWGIRK